MPVLPATRAPRQRAATRPTPASRGSRNPAGRRWTVYAATASNVGDADSAPTVSIAGPTAATIVLVNVTQGRTVTLNLTSGLASGQTLTVDMATGTVKRDGVVLTGALQVGSRLWSLGPGANTLHSSEPGTTIPAMRSAWR